MPSTDEAQNGQSQIQPTSAQEWGRKIEEGAVHELPSGNFARVRRTLDLLVMLRAGKIPNPLAGIVRSMIQTQKADFPLDKMDEQTLSQLLDLLDNNAAAAMVDPKVEVPPRRNEGEADEDYNVRFEKWDVERLGRGALSAWQLDVQDKLYLMGLSQGRVVDLQSFREEQERAMAGLSLGSDVPKPTKRTAGAAKR